MIRLAAKKDCSGCNACGDVCPKGAVRFEPDAEGFLYPVFDEAKCIGCGLCDKVCPQIHAPARMRDIAANVPKAWAAVATSLPIRFDSTSGGIYSVLAQEVLDRGGIVGGAVWGDAFEIRQVVSDNPADLPKLRSSKYAQSDARGFYKAVKAALGTGRLVFVCGTPCQMLALKLSVGEVGNLLTADFICRGINSPLAMRKYIESFEAKHASKVVSIKQKSKELGWRSLATKFVFANGDVEYDPRWQSPFMKSYLVHNVLSRPSCYECRCKGLSRVTDFTFADCWGIADRLDEGRFGKDLGTSLVLCHTPKAQRFFEDVKGRLHRTPVSPDEVIATSAVVCKSLPLPVVDRDKFYADLAERDFAEVVAALDAPPAPPSRHVKCFRTLRWLKHMLALAWNNKGCLRALARLNGGVRRLLRDKPYFEPHGRVLARIAPSASIVAKRNVAFGLSVFPGSNLESRIRMEPDSSFSMDGGTVSYGCDIELFPGARLAVGKGFYANIGLTLICAGKIDVGDGVTLGRNVTIRDFHGDHWLNAEGYQTIRPVSIGDHVWIGEHATVMPGVKIGAGSVVASHSLVTRDVPPNSLVAGSPARVIRENVQWKR